MRVTLPEKERQLIGWTEQVSLARKLYLALEFLFLFLFVPALVFYDWLPFSKLGILLVFTILCSVMLVCDRTCDWRKLWNYHGLRRSIRNILLRFIPASIMLITIIAMLEPGMMFYMPLNDFNNWLLVVLLYPLLSVYPQEIIYRAFLFQRYQPLFPRQRFMIHVSALSFGYMHIIFGNYPAIFLTYGAGYLFGRTYAESKSLLAVSVEHGLYGVLIFTIGFNHYFLNSVVLDVNLFFSSLLERIALFG